MVFNATVLGVCIILWRFAGERLGTLPRAREDHGGILRPALRGSPGCM